MASKRFQDLDVYRLAEKLSEEIWNIVQDWKPLAQNTVGKQMSLVTCPLLFVPMTNDQ